MEDFVSEDGRWKYTTRGIFPRRLLPIQPCKRPRRPDNQEPSTFEKPALLAFAVTMSRSLPNFSLLESAMNFSACTRSFFSASCCSCNGLIVLRILRDRRSTKLLSWGFFQETMFLILRSKWTLRFPSLSDSFGEK